MKTRCTNIGSISILGSLTNESTTLTFTKDLSTSFFGVSIVRNKYAKDPRITKQDMVILDAAKIEKIKNWILNINPKDSESFEELFVRCDCFSELLDFNYYADEDKLYVTFYDNYFLKTWKTKKYFYEFYTDLETFKSFAKDCLAKAVKS